MEEVVIDDAKKKAIQGFCNEMSASMTRTSGERDFQKEAIKNLASQWDVDKKLLRKMAKIFHDSKFNTVKEDNAELESTYQKVFGDGAI